MIPWFPPTRLAIMEVQRIIAERRAEQSKAKPGAVDRLFALQQALAALQFMDDLTVIEGMQPCVESNGTPVSSSPSAEQSPPPFV